LEGAHDIHPSLNFSQRRDATERYGGVQSPTQLDEPIGVQRCPRQCRRKRQPAAGKIRAGGALEHSPLNRGHEGTVACVFRAEGHRRSFLQYRLKAPTAEPSRLRPAWHGDLDGAAGMKEQSVTVECRPERNAVGLATECRSDGQSDILGRSSSPQLPQGSRGEDSAADAIEEARGDQPAHQIGRCLRRQVQELSHFASCESTALLGSEVVEQFEDFLSHYAPLYTFNVYKSTLSVPTT